MLRPRPTTARQGRASPLSAATMYLIDAEAHAVSAARLVELDPNPAAQREAAILYLAARRLRTRRQAAA